MLPVPTLKSSPAGRAGVILQMVAPELFGVIAETAVPKVKA